MSRSFAVKRRNQRVLQARWKELNQRVTDDCGREKLCGCCQEWWPLSEEFFGFIRAEGHYRSYCRACEADQTRNWRTRKAGKVAA